MVNNNVTSIKSLLLDSLFEQPIMVDGIVMNDIIRDENAMWDLTHIFDGTPDWMPKSIGYENIIISNLYGRHKLFLQFKGKPAVWNLSFMARPVYAFLDDIVDDFVTLSFQMVVPLLLPSEPLKALDYHATALHVK